VELEVAACFELEEKPAALAVDQEGRLALAELHQKIEIAATARERTMPATTTQMTTFVKFLFCMLF
jgi:hypothetical protein